METVWGGRWMGLGLGLGLVSNINFISAQAAPEEREVLLRYAACLVGGVAALEERERAVHKHLRWRRTESEDKKNHE